MNIPNCASEIMPKTPYDWNKHKAVSKHLHTYKCKKYNIETTR
jgi:hypothetical protein